MKPLGLDFYLSNLGVFYKGNWRRDADLYGANISVMYHFIIPRANGIMKTNEKYIFWRKLNEQVCKS